MGDIAEMMLDGTLCECCGVYIGSDAGYPQYCSETCANDRGMTLDDGIPVAKDTKPRLTKTTCPDCGRRVKEIGLADHRRAVHGVLAKVEASDG